MDEGLIILEVGAVLCGSLLVALGAVRTGVPVLIAFLGLGMLLGSEGPGGVWFDDPQVAQGIGTVGLVLILYEGGLQTPWRQIRHVLVPASLLSTVGVIVSALLTGVAARFLFGLSWLEAILLGSVVASTDAAAVFATLRFTRIRPRLARTLEAESGGNDPMAIALTLGFIAWIENPHTYGLDNLALLVLRQLGIGLAIGLALGVGSAWIVARLPRAIAPFAPVASIAVAALAFGITDVAGGSGFLAVYIVGVAVGSSRSAYRQQLVAFHEGVAFLAQVALFVALGLFVFPHELLRIALPGLALSVLLVVVIRPVGVVIATALCAYSARERALLGWAGLRGAVPIVLATFVLTSSVRHRDTIFNAVFFVVVVSTAVQGTTLEWLARRLGLLEPEPEPDQTEAQLAPGASGSLDMSDYLVAQEDAIVGETVHGLTLPRDALVAAVSRGDTSMRPLHDTVIEVGDHLYVLAPQGSSSALEAVFATWRRGS